MSEENDTKFRTSDRLELRNVRVMWVGEPREVGTGDRKTLLASAKVISQPGNERDMDAWVTFTGGAKMGERISELKKGDRVNVSGKPYFSAYIDKEGNPRPVVEIKYPDNLDVVFRAPTEEVAEEETVEEETPVEEAPKPTNKRGPGRPKKVLAFDNE